MKVLIVGNDEFGHDATVKDAFLAAYPSGQWEHYEGNPLSQIAFDYAKDNGFDAIIYSYDGLTNYFSSANFNPDIMLFMPVNNDTYTLPQQLVTVDCGNDLQVNDIYQFRDDTQSADSYSNGYVCGQLFDIAFQCNCSLQEARIRANATLDANKVINVANAVAYTGEIKLTVKTITAVRGIEGNVAIELGRIIDSTRYEIDVYKEDIFYETLNTTEITYDYVLPDYGNYSFKYRGLN